MVAVALVLAALGLLVPRGLLAAPALAAPPTSGFIVAAPGSLSGSASLVAGSARRAGGDGYRSAAAASGLGERRRRHVARRAPRAGRRRPAATVDTGARFDMIGVLFRSTAAGVRAVRFRLRTSLDGVTWTPWFSLKADAQSGPAGSTLSKADLVTEPVWVGAARYVQYEVVSAGASPAPVSDVRFACVESPATAATTPTRRRRRLRRVATRRRGSADSPVAAGRLGEPAEPAIVTRAQWGADEAYRSGPPLYGVVRCAFVHHTVNANTYTRAQAPALVRGIYYYHTKVNGWSDIGYNFLIDRFGTIYEGRYGGVAKAVIGAQVLGFNSMSTGVSLIGTFETVAPSPAALTSLERAARLEARPVAPEPARHGAGALLDRARCTGPASGSTCRSSSATGRSTTPSVPGTCCSGCCPPSARPWPASATPRSTRRRATPAAFSPNGDGVRDTVELRAALSGTDDWTIALSDAVGWSSCTGSRAPARWRARCGTAETPPASVVPDGTYTASFGATSANGTARPASIAVRIDTVSPAITGVSVAPGVISPNGDRFADAARVTFGVSEPCRVGMTVLDAKGAVVRTVAAVAAVGRPRAPGLGRQGELGRHPCGGGRRRLQRRRACGRRRRQPVDGQRAVTVDDTLGHPRRRAGLDFAQRRRRRRRRAAFVPDDAPGARRRRASPDRAARSCGASRSAAWRAGAHTWRWDGTNAAGAVVADGAYSCTIAAVNGVGTVAVKLRAHVDTVPPVAAWRAGALDAQARQAAARRLQRRRPLSPKAAATIVARSAQACAVAAVVAAGRDDRRGTQLVVQAQSSRHLHDHLSAVDLAGNRQGRRATLVVTVK